MASIRLEVGVAPKAFRAGAAWWRRRQRRIGPSTVSTNYLFLETS